MFLRSEFTLTVFYCGWPTCHRTAGGEKNISLILLTSARDAASGLFPRVALSRGVRRATLCRSLRRAPTSTPPSAASASPPREAAPRPGRPASGLRRHRHADLGFQRGTGLGPGSAAHRRGWPARGGGVPRTRRGGEFICRSISSPQLPSPFRRRFRRRLLPALDQHGAGKRRSLGCRFLYQVSRLSCRDVE